MLIRALKKISFQLYMSKNPFMDVDPIDLLINNFPEECLQSDVSPRIGSQYLSVCSQTTQQILNQTMYKGVIMGDRCRIFLTVPTKFPGMNKFYNVHYLLATGSPITTLTRKALCAIHQKEYKQEYDSKTLFPLTQTYQVGNNQIFIKCSNPDKSHEADAFHNVNLLGMNFFKQFKQVILNQNFQKMRCTVELSNTKNENWDKKIM